MNVVTFAVVVVPVLGGVVFTQAFKDQFVVHKPLDGLEEEGVEGQITHLLQFKLFIHCFQLLYTLCCLLQLSQYLVVLLQVAGELLRKKNTIKIKLMNVPFIIYLRPHLQGTHVPQHDITNPLVISLHMSIRATLPWEKRKE